MYLPVGFHNHYQSQLQNNLVVVEIIHNPRSRGSKYSANERTELYMMVSYNWEFCSGVLWFGGNSLTQNVMQAELLTKFRIY